MLCSNCGKELSNQAVICPDCGVGTPKYKRNHAKGFDRNSIGLNIFAFMFPILGTFFYFLKRDIFPIQSKNALIAALSGVGARILLYYITVKMIELSLESMAESLQNFSLL